MLEGGYDLRRALEQASRHLARADSEARAAQRYLDQLGDSEEEKALLGAVADARTLLDDAIETIRARTW
jgi:hypothetical protein